jgi:hypothetical protein
MHSAVEIFQQHQSVEFTFHNKFQKIKCEHRRGLLRMKHPETQAIMGTKHRKMTNKQNTTQKMVKIHEYEIGNHQNLAQGKQFLFQIRHRL